MFMLIVAAGAGLMLLAHIAPFPFLLDALAPAPSRWEMPLVEGAPLVYLTYDDGPNPEATPALLDVLAQEGAVATFFVLDRHLDDETAPIVARMFREGHAVALHSHTRRPMVLAPADFAAELRASANRIERLTGHRPCPAFRPHGGWRSGQMYVGLAMADYTLIGWGWWLWDWDWFRARDPDRLVRRFAGRVSGGDILVMHDGHHEDPRPDRRYAVDATARLVPLLQSQGFGFGTICQRIGA
jgi:peptidoglycan/xylan/chitin deacetylase (PgdA/CDA1 family)